MNTSEEHYLTKKSTLALILKFVLKTVGSDALKRQQGAS